MTIDGVNGKNSKTTNFCVNTNATSYEYNITSIYDSGDFILNSTTSDAVGYYTVDEGQLQLHMASLQKQIYILKMELELVMTIGV